MTTFNRLFMVLLALAWCAGLAGIGLLVWDEAREISVNRDFMNLALDVELTSNSEKILATIVLGLLALPALALLFAELKPSRRPAMVSDRRDDRYRESERRMDDVERRQPAAASSATEDRPREHHRWRLFGSHR